MEKIHVILILICLLNASLFADDFIWGYIEDPCSWPENAAKQRLKTAENLNIKTLYVEQLPTYDNPTSIQLLSFDALQELPLYKLSCHSILYGNFSSIEASEFSTPFVVQVDLMCNSKLSRKTPFSNFISPAIEKQFMFNLKRQIERMISLKNCRGIILNSEKAPMCEYDVNLLCDPEYRMKSLMTPETFKSLFAPCVTFAHLSAHNAYADESLDIELFSRSTQKKFNQVAIKWDLRNDKDLILKEGSTPFFDLKKDSLLIQKLTLTLDDLPLLSPLKFRTYLRSESNHALTEIATQQLMVFSPLEKPPTLNPKWADSVVITDSLPVVLEAIRAQKRVLFCAHAQGKLDSGYLFSLNSFDEDLLFQNNHPLLKPLVCHDYVDFYWDNVGGMGTTFNVTSLHLKTPPIVLSKSIWNSRTYSPLFELSVDTAKVLVCGFDLNSQDEDNLEKTYFKKALYDYMISDQFKPTDTAHIQWVKETFTPFEKSPMPSKTKKEE